MTSQDSSNPTEILPEDPEANIGVETFVMAYKRTDYPTKSNWKLVRDNGDPASNGGLWIAFDSEHNWWVVIKTTHASEWEDFDDIESDHPGYQYIERGRIPIQKLLTEDDGDIEWAHPMEQYQQEKSHSHVYPPKTIIDNELTEDVASFAEHEAMLLDPIDTRFRDSNLKGIVLEDSYHDVINNLGITPNEKTKEILQ